MTHLANDSQIEECLEEEVISDSSEEEDEQIILDSSHKSRSALSFASQWSNEDDFT